MRASGFEPAYLRLLRSGELEERVVSAYQHLQSCDLCAWECRVNRIKGIMGVCKSGSLARVASFGPHHGEEPPLRGKRGSGTIFFSRCNMRCKYCQNHDISQTDAGELVGSSELAVMMLSLQSAGCHNINFVSPSHVIPQILGGVLDAARQGLRLPLVFNTGGYDSLTALKLLDGIIDIYMPDMKYASSKLAQVYSKVRHYPEVNQTAVKEMYTQVGDLWIDDDGLAKRGLLVRHLVLPNGIAGTAEIVSFLANEISRNTYINLMAQYRPDYLVRSHPHKFPRLSRSLYEQEYLQALKMAREAGLDRIE